MAFYFSSYYYGKLNSHYKLILFRILILEMLVALMFYYKYTLHHFSMITDCKEHKFYEDKRKEEVTRWLSAVRNLFFFDHIFNS